MVYLNFNKIAPPAPNDPTVNVVSQINDNWDELDARILPYMIGGTITDMEVGQEAFDIDFNFVVQYGGGVRKPDDIADGWTAWTNLPLLAPRAVRPGFQPKWRSNPLYRMVEMSGGVRFDAAAGPWTLGSSFLINSDTAGSPPLSLLPVGGKHVQQCAAALTEAPAIVAGGYAIVENPGGSSSFTRIAIQYLGGPGGNNFVELDQIWWWY